MLRRFIKLGGVPRHVFDEAQDDPDNKLLQEALERVTWMGTILNPMNEDLAPDEVPLRIIMLDAPKWRQGARCQRRKMLPKSFHGVCT